MEARAPGEAGGGTDRDAEAHVLHGAQLGTEPTGLENGCPLEGDDNRLRVEQCNRPRDDVVPPEEARALELGHHADASRGQLEHLGECGDAELAELHERAPTERARRRRQAVELEIVEDDEPSVARCLDVELHIVRPHADRALERRERVLGLVEGRAAVRDHDHPSRRWTRATSIRGTSSSAWASRFDGSVPVTARQRRPARLADAIPASVSSNATTSTGRRSASRSSSARR